MSPDEQPLSHRIDLDQRRRLTVSGVDGVESFDEGSVIMTTRAGSLTVRGSGLHIEKLSLDGGDLLVSGAVDALIYEDPEERPEGFFRRLLRG